MLKHINLAQKTPQLARCFRKSSAATFEGLQALSQFQDEALRLLGRQLFGVLRRSPCGSCEERHTGSGEKWSDTCAGRIKIHYTAVVLCEIYRPAMHASYQSRSSNMFKDVDSFCQTPHVNLNNAVLESSSAAFERDLLKPHV